MIRMKNSKSSAIPNLGGCVAMAVVSLCCAAAVFGADVEAIKPLVLELPGPTFKGTPKDLPSGPNIEPLPEGPPPSFLVPKEAENVAAGKPVTASERPYIGELSQITDGKKEALDHDCVEMKKGTQWIQVDLEGVYAVYAVVLWHDHRNIQIMRDVVVQVSDDPRFEESVTTLFNNDLDNSSSLGAGTDREYFETRYGKIIDGKGVRGRYVRCHLKGSTSSALNCWQEVEVYGLSAK